MRTSVLDIRPTGLFLYELRDPAPTIPQLPTSPQTTKQQQTTPQPPTNNSSTNHQQLTTKTPYTGKLTERSKRRLQRAIALMLACTPWKTAPLLKTKGTFRYQIGFLTLTLPAPQGKYTDKELKKRLLDPYIKRLKRKYHLKSYIWRAERQKNGNLHFHLMIDTWIRHTDLRNDWNALLATLGYIDIFEQKHGHRNPNSIDIHAVKRVDNLAAYLVKYMSKPEASDDVILGKVWDCSTNLKRKDRCRLPWDQTCSLAWAAASRHPEAKILERDHFSAVLLQHDLLKECLPPELKAYYLSYLDSIHFDRPAPQPPSLTTQAV